MSLAKPYTTLARVQAEAKNSTTADVSTFETAIDDASRWIDAECRRDFLFHDHTVAPFSVPQAWFALNVMWIPWPIITLTNIDSGPVNGPFENLDATVYGMAPADPRSASGTIVRSGHWYGDDPFTSEGLLPERVYLLPTVYRLYGTFGYLPVRVTGVSAVAATDVFTKVAHGFVDGQLLAYVSGTGFDGLDDGEEVYVRDKTADTFKLARTAGGTAIDVTVDGSAGVFSNLATPSPTLPADLIRACTVVAAIFSGKATKDSVGLDGQRVSITLKQLPPEVQKTLKRYRQLVI